MAREETKARKVVKRVENAILYSDGSMRIDRVRFSYPHLDKPWKKKGDQGEPAYSLTGLMPKRTHKAARGLIQDRIDELLEENKVRKLADDRIFMRDGDRGSNEQAEGHWTISAREQNRPKLRDKNNDPVDPEDVRETFQPGYWGSMFIRPWFMDNEWGKRINAGLNAVRMMKEDETFGMSRVTDEELDDVFSDDDLSDDYDDDRPKSRRSRDDDDDDRPRSRRSRDDDDDDDRPRRRRSRDDDDDLGI